ncbi:hypothetical protein [Reyranella sp.]|uniref:hypothetical protein n=1 Tax=Reyranella sp. TaxID=1929291 RepID=UPI003D101CB8
MTDDERLHRYTIHVTYRGGMYSLHIPELLLAARATDLHDGYERLRKRQQELVDFARSMDALDELPPPAKPPALGSFFR